MAVTAQFGPNDFRDLTRVATWTSSDPAIARVEGTQIVPGNPGTAEIIAQIGNVTAKTTVVVTAKVSEPKAPHDPISFKTELLATLTKSGCNMGACHGSPTGKGGFRLSLRAYDPILDIFTLKSEYQGRRTNPMKPDESLVLRKPLMEVSHAGGQRFKKGDLSWQILRQWIAEGMKLDPAGTPDLLNVEVYPKQRFFGAGSTQGSTCDSQQLVVRGNFSDGSIRDLTPLAVYSSSSEAVATVDANGLMKKVGRGETTVLVRYLDKMATSAVTFLENVPDFAWNNPLEFNFIDGLINAKLKQLQILPSNLASEDEFVRRV